ncbi:MAG: hypothetical protein ACT4OF_16230 [Caulobacteraceae bacterium]
MSEPAREATRSHVERTRQNGTKVEFWVSDASEGAGHNMVHNQVRLIHVARVFEGAPTQARSLLK